MEKRTSEVFSLFLKQARPACPVTLISYHLGGPGKWVAWQSTLRDKYQVNDLMKAITKRWEKKVEPPLVTLEENRRLKLPTVEVIDGWLTRITRTAADPEMGFSLIAGKGKKYQYVSNGRREDVLPVMKKGLFG